MIREFIEKVKRGRLFQTKLFQSGLVRQFIKFGIIGLSNTGLSYVLYLIFLKFLKAAGFF